MKNKAFSLIELSVVILIIGILVAGVTQSSRLVKRMRLQTAQNLTQSSPVASIKDLTAWYETTLEKSFNDNEEQDQSDITVWYDVNPFSTVRNDATPPAVANRPKFMESAINGSLPSVKLDGIDDYLRSNTVEIVGPQFTYFVVAKRKAFVIYSSVFTTLSPSATFDNNSTLHLRGFFEVNASSMSAHRNGVGSGVTHPGNDILYIASSVFDGTNNYVYLNGTASGPTATSGPFNINSLIIGCAWQSGAASNCWNGEIAELIFFSRSLKNDERKSVEQYLSKKWSVKIN